MNNEPVAWMTQVVGGDKHKWDLVFNKPIPHDLYNSIPLYTAEQLHSAKTLTDLEIDFIAKEIDDKEERGDSFDFWYREFARAILRKANEK